MRALGLGLLLLGAACARDPGLDAARTFEEANRLYLDGKYEEAAARYEALDLESGAVLYNLGNAWFRAGQRGRAVAAYRRAQRYRPGDPYVEANLAQALRTDAEAPAKGVLAHVFFWQDWLSYPAKFRWLSLAATLAFLLALLARFRRAWRPALWGALVVTALLAGSAALAWHDVAGTTHGVTTTPDLVARKGNAETFEPAFTEPLPEATEFTVIEARRDWLHVRLSGGLEGWIRRADAVTY